MKIKFNKLLKAINKKEFLFAFLLTLSLVLLVFLMGYYNNKVIIKNPDPKAHYLLEPSNPLSILSNWDGPNYLNVAKNSYTNPSQTIFLPLYPFLVHSLNIIIHSYLDSALLVSWISLFFALYFYIKIIKEVFNKKDNFSVLNYLLFFIFFPTAVFLVATYTESLFAFLSLASIYFALKKRYLLSSISSFLLAITNVDAALVIFFIFLIMIENKSSIKKIIGYLIVAFSSLVAYLTYLDYKFNSPVAFLTSQKNQGWLNHNYFELIIGLNPFSLIFLVLLVLSIKYWWNKRKSFSIYSFLFILIPVLGNQFGGFNRYVLMAFPMQLMLYDYLKNKPKLYTFSLILTTICWSYFVFQYVAGYVGG